MTITSGMLFPTLHVQKLKIPFPTQPGRRQISPNMGYWNLMRADFNDYGSLYTRLSHDNVVSFLALNFESFQLKYLD